MKVHDLISSPAYTVITAADRFADPTKRINELWQTDFTYFEVIHWGWYYLSTLMDDYSRYVIAWEFCRNATAEAVRGLLDRAITISRVKHVNIVNRPRMLSDNGSCYIARDLAEYLQGRAIRHIRSKPYHPQTQGKIERYHRSLKNVVELDNYWIPEELERQIETFVDYYNNRRYHEALDNLTPADVYFGQGQAIFDRRKKIKRRTIKQRRLAYRNMSNVNNGNVTN